MVNSICRHGLFLTHHESQHSQTSPTTPNYSRQRHLRRYIHIMNRNIAAITILLLTGCSSTESLSSASTEVAEIESAAQSSTTTVPAQTDDAATTSTVADRPAETSSTTTTEPEPVHLYGPFTGDPSAEESDLAEEVVTTFISVFRATSDHFFAEPPPRRPETTEGIIGSAAVIEQCTEPHSGRYQLRAFLVPYGDNIDMSHKGFDDVVAMLPTDTPLGSGVVAFEQPGSNRNYILLESFCFERNLLPESTHQGSVPDDWDWDWSSLEPCCQTSYIPEELHESTVHIDDLDLTLFTTGESEPRTWVFSSYGGFSLRDGTIVLRLEELGLQGACDVMAQRQIDAGFISSFEVGDICLSDREEGPYEMSVIIPLERLQRDLSGKDVLLQFAKLLSNGWFDFDVTPAEQFVEILRTGDAALPEYATQLRQGQFQVKFIVDGLGTAHVSAFSAYPTP